MRRDLRDLKVLPLACILHIAAALIPAVSATAQTVWTGLSLSFSKPDSADTSLPENQDRITDNVWLTRESQFGLYNIHDEFAYTSTSPAGTEWATELNNPGATISAANWAGLSFDSWIDVYGGLGSGLLPDYLIDRDAVVHLIADDIYLDLRFTGWTAGAGGGGFSYLRAEVPEPATALLAGFGLLIAIEPFMVRRLAKERARRRA